MRPSKQGRGGGGSISGHVSTLHQRLFHALNLGTSYYEGKELNWKCTDIEIQRHVVRSIAAFLDSVSAETLQHPLFKDSIPHIVGALVWILQCESGAVLSIAANEVVKLLNCVPNSIIQHYVLDLSHPLLSLLTSHELEVCISCAIALNMILSKMNVNKEKQMWKMMKDAKTVECIVTNIRNFSGETMPIEYFQEMSSLLSLILWRWPPSRNSVWNDAVLMKVLEALLLKPDLSFKVAVLKLYYSVGLCGNGAKKLLENGVLLLQTMVYCMDSSHALSVRIEGFRLAQCLAMNRDAYE